MNFIKIQFNHENMPGILESLSHLLPQYLVVVHRIQELLCISHSKIIVKIG